MNKKYAMVTINSRQNANGEELVRRVLIEYGAYENNVFKQTRFIEKDPYFYDIKASHKYNFSNDSYILYSTQEELEAKQLLNWSRPYHYNPTYAPQVGIDESVVKPILFEADNDKDAIEIFKNRKELR